MAGCAPDLDDGELYLPSDIFPDEVDDSKEHVRRKLDRFCSVGCSSELAYMEDLARKLAALGLFERSRRGISVGSEKPNPRPDLSLHSEGFIQQSRFGLAAREPEAPFGYGGQQLPPVAMGPISLFRTPAIGAYDGIGRAMYPLDLVKPNAQQQVSDFGRATVMHRRQQTHLQSRLLPARLGGSRRESGGTGVFLPRVINDSAMNNTGMTNRAEQGHYQHQQRRLIQQQQQQLLPMRGSSSAEVMWRSQGMSNQPLSEPGLPQDWTY